MSFDRAELERATYHLAFDIYHFRFYTRLHKEYHLAVSDPAIYQAVLYSLLLHFRLLLDFFYKQPVHDDCWVGHFRVLPGFTAAFPPAIHIPPVGAREVSVNLNKRLAHMTATRWRERQPDMDYYTNYFADLESLIVAFRAALPGDMRQILDRRLSDLDAQYKRGL